MVNKHSKWCTKYEAYFDQELVPVEQDQFQIHLTSCVRCQRNIDKLMLARNSMRVYAECRLPEEAELRIRSKLHEQICSVSRDEEILDLEGVAHFLHLPLDQVVQLLDSLPSFEIGGRVRVRRSQLIAWIEDQEKKHTWERKRASSRSQVKIIQFPGGKA